jgi:FMN-dependent NADH-azoreductase
MTMATVLQINSSVLSTGNANRLADRFVTRWQDNHRADRVVLRDLTRNPVPHLSDKTVAAFFTPADQRTAEQLDAVKLSDDLVAELKAADVIVMSVPMYNFGIPSPLKAWIDHVARAGITFKYTEKGPVGLLDGKKVYIIAARGGLHAGTERDAQTQYLKTVLAFLGLTDVEFVYAEGYAISPEQRAKAEAQAQERIHLLTALQAA